MPLKVVNRPASEFQKAVYCLLHPIKVVIGFERGLLKAHSSAGSLMILCLGGETQTSDSKRSAQWKTSETSSLDLRRYAMAVS